MRTNIHRCSGQAWPAFVACLRNLLLAGACIAFPVAAAAEPSEQPPRLPAVEQNLADPVRQYMREFPVKPAAPREPSATLEVERKAKPAVALKPGLKIDIKGFRFSGLTEVSEAQLQPLLERHIGPGRGFEDLESAINTVAEYLRAEGYFLAQAYLPAQKVQDGVVEIAVLEGRIGEVRVETSETVRVSKETVASILSVLRPGMVIREDSVERALFLVGDLRGVKVHSVMEPGKQTGTADLLVRLEPGQAFEYSLDADNMGSEFTGRYRLGAAAAWNNPLHSGDSLAGRAMFSTDGGLAFGRLSYLLPVGPYGTKLGFAYTHLEYEITQGSFSSKGFTGNANVVSAFVLHPLLRGRNLNLFGTLGYDWRNQEDVNPLLPNRPDQTDIKDFHVGNIGLVGDSRDSLLGGGINSFSASLTLGGLDIASGFYLRNDVYGTNGAYQKGNLVFSRLQQIAGPVLGFVSISGQVASKNLSSSEKFSLGGPAAVRAYGVGESPSDEMMLFTTELRAALPKPQLIPGDVMASVFLDNAYGRLFQTPLPTSGASGFRNTQHRMGVGLGLTWGRQEDFLVKGYAAWRLTERSTTGTSTGYPQIFFSLSKSF